ncbi:unnamed protein product [Meganyctiphanes norvegica]|uniref:Protein sleepless n=1 Tax=Meganyctiphanes norvegica TaxID=48144 RepID=A0AAV2PZ73_MEGNR
MMWLQQSAGIVALLSTVVILSLPTPGHGEVECFVCSFSPRSNYTRMDECMPDNFTQEYVQRRTCEHGCESVKTLDLNGELETFHRNCAQSSSVTSECERKEGHVLTQIVCTCDWDYCNMSVTSCSFCGHGLMLLIAIGRICDRYLLP